MAIDCGVALWNKGITNNGADCDPSIVPEEGGRPTLAPWSCPVCHWRQRLPARAQPLSPAGLGSGGKCRTRVAEQRARVARYPPVKQGSPAGGEARAEGEQRTWGSASSPDAEHSTTRRHRPAGARRRGLIRAILLGAPALRSGGALLGSLQVGSTRFGPAGRSPAALPDSLGVRVRALQADFATGLRLRGKK